MTGFTKRMIRLISLLLLLSMLLLCGCESGGSKEPDDTTIADDTTVVADDTTEDEGSYEPLDLPDTLDFGGAEVRFISRVSETGSTIFSSELLVEDLNNSVVNDAIYNRQIWVEDALNIKLYEFAPTGGGDKIAEYLERMITAGDQDCEIVAASSMSNAQASIGGYFMNVSDIPYIRMSDPWWYSTYADRSSLGDALFFFDGDLSLTTLKQSYVVAYNKNFAEARGIDDLYELVFDGNWTLDALLGKINGVYIDLNGNSEMDEEDQFGIVANYCFADSYWVSFDIPVFSKDEDNHLIYTLNQEKYGIAFDKTMGMQKSVDAYMHAAHPLEVFSSGNALFYGMELGDTESAAMRNMQDVYGILPVPKFDENQSGYYTMPHDTHTSFAVPSNVKDPEMVGAVLDALGWYSYRYVTPAYLDVALKGQYANDPETRRVLDLVTGGLSFESAWIYSFQLTGVAQTWRYLLYDQNESWAQDLKTRERKINILLKDLNDKADKLVE